MTRSRNRERPVRSRPDPGRLADAAAVGDVLPPGEQARLAAWYRDDPEGRAEGALYAAMARLGAALEDAAADAPDAGADEAQVTAALSRWGVRRKRRRAWHRWGAAAAVAGLAWFGGAYVAERGGWADRGPAPEVAATAAEEGGGQPGGPGDGPSPNTFAGGRGPVQWIDVARERACVELGEGVRACGRSGTRLGIDGTGEGGVVVAAGVLEVEMGGRVAVLEVSPVGPGRAVEGAARVSVDPEGEVWVLVLAAGAAVRDGEDGTFRFLAAGTRVPLGTFARDSEGNPSDAAEPAGPSPRERLGRQAPADLLRRAQAAAAAGRSERARMLYRQLVRRAPHAPEGVAALAMLGTMELRAGRARKALAYFDRYLRAGGPGVAEARRGRALALEALGRTGEAVAAWRGVIEADESGMLTEEARGRLARLSGGAPPQAERATGAGPRGPGPSW